jgi:hypothetical protein
MSVSFAARSRPRLWRDRQASDECELAPSGTRGGLTWIYWHQCLREPIASAPNLDDCLVARPKPFRLVIWEPLLTKAPGPHLAAPYCCYIKTVIFYHRPYIASPWIKLYEANGRLRSNGSPGHFEEWDHVETRLTWDEQLEFEGEIFEVGGGVVLWGHQPGEPRRWWMRRGARRVQEEAT